eukprot:TRINITY_DN42878_c0_g1_i1.p2 TRINITY_DN42878_c0_g1~~TRINITY_DN42878_c0_g1_i1.p2  ORF type:complete len:147 (+),score=39.07 TRINITY_DN42878_c0_g1_i1:159-599(+)
MDWGLLTAGVLFAKFRDTHERDAALRRLRDKSSRDGDNEYWAKPDMPLEQRVVQSFLFGAKYLFAKWGFAKTALWVDLDKSEFYVGNGEVANVTMKSGKLEVKVATDWKADLVDDPEWKKLIEMAETKLGAKGKGAEKGKGKPVCP